MIDTSYSYLPRVVAAALDSRGGRQVNDMYKDLREWLPPLTACRLLAWALESIRQTNLWFLLPLPGGLMGLWARKLAALKRLIRYTEGR